MKIQSQIISGLILAAVLLSGCFQTSSRISPPADQSLPVSEPKTAQDPIPDNVNEAGRIPILMYHRIRNSESDYDRTPELFTADLERLYNDGYRPISLKDFIAGRVDVPAGFSPVVITFDDGDRSQYKAGESSPIPTAECAVGIMEAFKAKHPDFNPQATFFLNGGVPFGQKTMLKAKLNYLVLNGYTIGNHTFSHEKLSTLTPEDIAVTLGKNAAELESLSGKPVNLLALPFGNRPKDSGAMAAVISGSFEGNDYQNVGICNVGWQPELPAYIEGFDPMTVNRIRCGDDSDEAGDWLTRLAAHPETRYISDGDPDTVTVPASKAPLVKKPFLGEMKLRIVE